MAASIRIEKLGQIEKCLYSFSAHSCTNCNAQILVATGYFYSFLARHRVNQPKSSHCQGSHVSPFLSKTNSQHPRIHKPNILLLRMRTQSTPPPSIPTTSSNVYHCQSIMYGATRHSWLPLSHLLQHIHIVGVHPLTCVSLCSTHTPEQQCPIYYSTQ